MKFVPDERLFRGQRLLVRRGVSPRFGPHARLETGLFAFRHTTYAISLDHLDTWQAKVILGTLLSPMGRYWLYMVSGSWGTWMDEIRSSDLLNLPLRLPTEPDRATRLIEEAVGELQRPTHRMNGGVLATQMQQLDDGMAELFELSDAERYLVADFWAAQAQESTNSVDVPLSAESGFSEDDLDLHSQEGIWPYLRVFLRTWNQRLSGRGTLVGTCGKTLRSVWLHWFSRQGGSETATNLQLSVPKPKAGSLCCDALAFNGRRFRRSRS